MNEEKVLTTRTTTTHVAAGEVHAEVVLQPEAMLHRMDPRHVVVEVKRGGEDVAAQETRPPPQFEEADRKWTVDLIGMTIEGVPHRRRAFGLEATDLHHSFKMVTSHVSPSRVPATFKESHYSSLSHRKTHASKKIKARESNRNNLTCESKKIKD
jgi:hypothetical protein